MKTTKNKLVKTNKVGRPSKYNPIVINPLVEEYLQGCTRENTKLPSIEGLALFLKVNPDTIYEWSQKHVEFSDTLVRLRILQKEEIINSAFYGGREINSNVGLFLLRTNHGMNDSAGHNVNVQVNVQPILGEMTAE